MQNTPDRVPRLAWILLAVILVLAAGLRFIQLEYAPSGGHGDVSWIGINALDWVDRGIWPFYVRELYAPEPFPVYLTGLLLPFTGVSFLPQRIITAAAGVLLVGFAFPATWALLDGKSVTFRASAGLLASLSTAVSLHVVALNRLGMESPPFLTVVMLLIWLTARAWNRGGYGKWAAAGAALALAQYVFLAARLLPIVLALWILHVWWADRARLKAQWRGWLVMAAVSFILTLPALILFVTTPEAFSARADAGTAQTGGWIWEFDTSAYGGIVGLIAQKIGLTLLALGIRWEGPYNIMQLPMLGPLFFVGFVIAVVMGLRRFRHIAYGWPLLAIPVMLFTDLISGAVLEIHALHQMGVLPFVFILSGIGLAHAWQLGRPYLASRTLRLATVVIISLLAVVPAVLGMAEYLNVVIPAQYADPEAGWNRAQTDVDLARYLVDRADEAFLLPYSEYNRSDVAWFLAEGFRQRASAVDAGGMLSIPELPQELQVVFPTSPERPRHDGFPAHFDPRLWVLLHNDQVWLLPPLTDQQTQQILNSRDDIPADTVIDRSQTEIARLYAVDAPAALLNQRSVVDYPVDAVINDEVRLLGYSVTDQNLQPGSILFVSLYWLPLKPIQEDYEVFVQLWNDEQTSFGGAHDFPYGGMYRSRIWQTDEVVTTHHWVEVPADLPIGRYAIATGLYRLLHNERLPVTGADTQPEHRAVVAPDLRLAPPAPAALSQTPARTMQFGDFFKVDSYTIQVNDTVVASADEVEVRPGDQITVELVWEATERPDKDYSAFLHLSGDASAPPVAQADVQMGGNFPTGAWRVEDEIYDTLTLAVPDDLAAGTYDLLLGTYFWQTGERLAAYQGDSIMDDGRLPVMRLIVRE
ncbi:MAG: hypothetical protein CL610_09315 [Anaerolineaceae bacterium]|nr:hypothetical protein [Anaerolineaceae bacterium]